jgi:uncharacterized protein (TIGR00369 family)
MTSINASNESNSFPVDIDVPFLKLLGVQLLKMTDGEGVVTLSIEEKHLNTWGTVHGGALLTMADAAMAIAARAGDPDDRSVVTIELKNMFMLTPTGKIRVVGNIIQRSVTMAFCEAKVYDENNKVCCMATGTFKYFKKMVSRDASGARVVKEDNLSI